jgi:hypothetical protein
MGTKSRLNFRLNKCLPTCKCPYHRKKKNVRLHDCHVRRNDSSSDRGTRRV